MMKASETKVLDMNSEFLGTPPETLMENAGKGLADIIDSRFEDRIIAIVCGTGNNGGDGFVAARALADRGWKVKVLLVKSSESIRTGLSKSKLVEISGLQIRENADPSELEGRPVIMDAMLGTGMAGKIREPYRTWIEAINSAFASSKIISVDVPSGLGADLAVRPHITVTFHDSKEGMNTENSGDVIIHDIKIPEDARKFTGPGEFANYPRPKKDSHKGQNGRVLVIGGGPYTGAPALAAMAAYASGADLVTLAVPENCFGPIAGYSPVLVVRPLHGNRLAPEHAGEIMEMAENADAVIIGPGGGRDPETLSLFISLISKCRKPMVIDADALSALKGNTDILGGKRAVLTPHKGEFTGLSDDEPTADSVEKLTGDLGVTVLLKGHEDIISDGSSTKLNRTGNPGMTVGGTGDVLAGLVGGIMAKGAEPYDAARMGAYLCGTAGDLAFDEMGYSMTAPDVIYCVPEALKEILAFVDSD